MKKKKKNRNVLPFMVTTLETSHFEMSELNASRFPPNTANSKDKRREAKRRSERGSETNC